MTGACDVCSRIGEVAVGASSCGPASFAYCRFCAYMGFEPLSMLVYRFGAAIPFLAHDLQRVWGFPFVMYSSAERFEEKLYANLVLTGDTENMEAWRI